MPGVVDTLRLIYEVDVVDKGTKHLLASERAAQKSVVQTSRALAQQDTAQKRSASVVASAAATRTRATRSTATEVARLSRVERAAISDTKRLTVATRQAERANDRLAASTRRAETAEARRKRAASRGPAITTRAAGRARGAVAGVTAGFGALSAGRFIAAEYTEAARLQAVIAQGIKTTGGAANVTAAHVERMSAAMSRQAGIDDEVIGKGASVILTFTKIRNEAGKNNQIFDRANQAALDLSVRFGKDLTSTSIQVGKALNDPVKGVTALAKAGVQFDEQQKKQIKTMVESGNVLGAQKLILRELETQVGGTAKAQAQPVDRLKVSVGNLAEAAGTALAPSVEKAADSAADFIDQMATGTGGGGRFAAQMRGVAKDLKPVAQGMLSVGKFLTEHPRLVMGLVGAYGTLRAVRFASGIVKQISDLRDAAGKSKIAERIADGARGTGRLVKRALSGVGGIIRGVMQRAGRSGGAAVADSIASSAGANMGPALDRNQRGILGGRSGGRWSRLGRSAGKLFGIAAAAMIAIEVAKSVPALEQYSGKKGWGELWRDLKNNLKLPDPLHPKRRGGIVSRYQHGGLVPLMASGGELLVDGGRATMIPGPSDRDATPMLARPGAAILTADGQARMSMGASLTEAVRMQAPHFAKGGVVPGKYTATSYGPPWGGIQGTGVTKTGVNLKRNPQLYGIATDPRLIALGSKVFAHPNPFGYTGRFSAFDTGGAIKGRRIDFYDWRGRKHQNAWGRRQVTISRSRIAPRQDGEDTYRARGGGGTETSVSVLGRSRRRAGLLGDAFAQGQAAGQAGLTRGIIRREGNPILAAIREASATSSSASERARKRQRGASDADVGGVAGVNVKGSKPGFAVFMALFRKKFGSGIYVMSGARPGSRVAGSDRISNHASGDAIDITHKGIEAASSSRPPESLNKTAARRMDRLHRYIGWKVPQPPRRDFLWRTNQGGNHFNHIHLGMDPSATNSVSSARAFLRGGRSTDTLRGLPRARAGGIVGRFRPGGFVAGGGQAAGNATGGVGTQLTRGLRTAMTFAGGSLEALDNIIGRSMQQRLVALREQIEQRVKKGGPAKVVQRLQGVLDMIDFELGRRVGRIQDVVQERVGGIDRARGAVERSQRARGVDSGSLQGVNELGVLQEAETNVRAQNVQSLSSALQRATAARNRDAVREITTQLNEAHDALQESTVQQIELAREAARLMREAVAEQAQEVVDAATSQSTMADLGLQRLELEQRLVGTFGGAGGAQGRADFIRQSIIPAIQQEIAALDVQRLVAQQQGNADLVRQLDEQIFGRQNDILQRQLDANEQTAENTEALKEFGGSIAFSYRDTPQLDNSVDIIRARTGA